MQGYCCWPLGWGCGRRAGGQAGGVGGNFCPSEQVPTFRCLLCPRRHNLFARTIPSFSILLTGGEEQLELFAAQVRRHATSVRVASPGRVPLPRGGARLGLQLPLQVPAAECTRLLGQAEANSAGGPARPCPALAVCRWQTATARRCRQACQLPWQMSLMPAGRGTQTCAPQPARWCRCCRRSGTLVGGAAPKMRAVREEIASIGSHIVGLPHRFPHLRFAHCPRLLQESLREATAWMPRSASRGAAAASCRVAAERRQSVPAQPCQSV